MEKLLRQNTAVVLNVCKVTLLQYSCLCIHTPCENYFCYSNQSSSYNLLSLDQILSQHDSTRETGTILVELRFNKIVAK